MSQAFKQDQNALRLQKVSQVAQEAAANSAASKSQQLVTHVRSIYCSAIRASCKTSMYVWQYMEELRQANAKNDIDENKIEMLRVRVT